VVGFLYTQNHDRRTKHGRSQEENAGGFELCRATNKNADKQEIDNYRKNLVLSNFSHANMMSIVGKDHQIALGIEKKHESVFSKFEPFVRKVGGISIGIMVDGLSISDQDYVTGGVIVVK
jgi:hypothetical protein